MFLKKLATEVGVREEKQLRQGKLLYLKELRDEVWQASTELAVKSRRMYLTVQEFLQIQVKIETWLSEFKTFLVSRPDIYNFPKIDEQLIQRRTEFQILENRGAYLTQVTELRDVVSSVLLNLDQNLKAAKEARRETENNKVIQRFYQFFKSNLFYDFTECIYHFSGESSYYQSDYVFTK